MAGDGIAEQNEKQSIAQADVDMRDAHEVRRQTERQGQGQEQSRSRRNLCVIASPACAHPLHLGSTWPWVAAQRVSLRPACACDVLLRMKAARLPPESGSGPGRGGGRGGCSCHRMHTTGRCGMLGSVGCFIVTVVLPTWFVTTITISAAIRCAGVLIRPSLHCSCPRPLSIEGLHDELARVATIGKECVEGCACAQTSTGWGMSRVTIANSASGSDRDRASSGQLHAHGGLQGDDDRSRGASYCLG